jgi:hypothetical protein
VHGRLSLTIDLKRSEARLFDRIRAELHGSRDYEGAVKVAFDDLSFKLLRFVSIRLDAIGSRYPYLNEIAPGNEPKEVDLQRDLFQYLAGFGYPIWEFSNVASGRADIVIPYGSFNFSIETKQDAAEWLEGSVAAFVAQATAYQQTDVRLGVLAVLDLSARRPGDPALEGCFFVATDRYSATDERTVLVVRVPGNKRTPSRQ